MNLPRIRWSVLAPFVAFALSFVGGDQNYFYASREAIVAGTTALGFILSMLKLLQERLRMDTEEPMEYHTMERGTVRPSLWRRVW